MAGVGTRAGTDDGRRGVAATTADLVPDHAAEDAAGDRAERAALALLGDFAHAFDGAGTYEHFLPRLAAPFGVFLMTGYFKAIPRDIEEAALLDNTPRWKIFLRVLLPLTIPAQATLGIFTFLTAWNDYLWPLISATKPEMFTVPIALKSFLEVL